VVQCDSERVQQALSNLISNAIRFTARGQVVVSAGRDPEDHDRVVFAVCDTGVGIAHEHVSHVFDEFWKGPGSTSRRGSAGLGLAIVRLIVHGHGGRVWVESEPGCGSTFSFSLPLEPADTAAV